MEQWFEECGCGLELLATGLQDAGQHTLCARPARCGYRRAGSEQLSFLRRNQHAKQIQPGQTGLNWRSFRDQLAQFLESVRLTGAVPGTVIINGQDLEIASYLYTWI
jgi:hypothetical protein